MLTVESIEDRQRPTQVDFFFRRCREDLRAVLTPVPEVLGEVVLSQQGTFRRVRRYLRGWHPELGVLHRGLQGKETIVEVDVIRPVQTVTVAAELSIFHFNDQTGMAEIIARKANFNPETGILEVTDRSGQVDAKLQDIFSSRINELVAA